MSELAQNGTNLGVFKISFSTFWLGKKISFNTFWLGVPKCTETDLKNSQICPFYGQSTMSVQHRPQWINNRDLWETEVSDAAEVIQDWKKMEANNFWQLILKSSKFSPFGSQNFLTINFKKFQIQSIRLQSGYNLANTVSLRAPPMWRKSFRSYFPCQDEIKGNKRIFSTDYPPSLC